MMKTLKELEPLIIQWATEKNIHLPECASKQKLKLIEECGELASAILKKDVELQKDAIGDMFVVLVILNKQMESELEFDFVEIETTIVDHYDYLNNISCLTDFLYCELSVLNDLSIKLNHDLTECANIAWNEIKNRTGKTVDGTFIKN